jgi:putative nucleotidyltransferase with HDIG domain
VRMNGFIARHFEKILVILILVTAFAGTYFVEEKFVVLNFYYLPVLVASYFLGRRMGILISVFSILSVLFFVFIFPGGFLGDQKLWSGFALLSAWSGFLILASIAVGTLYEQNERRLTDVKNAYIGILEILSKYLESSDRYTRGHSIRVSELAMEIAIAMELPRLDVENIRVAGLLHDLGKIEISGEILRRAADLGVEQGSFSDSPSVRGTRLLASVGSVLKEVVPIVVAHQKYFMSAFETDEEKEVEKIPMPVRIIAVADAYDTLMSDRPYRKAMAPSEALEEIVAKAGKQFDPGAVEAFKLVFQKRQKEVETA